jgi:hypothetical protein
MELEALLECSGGGLFQDNLSFFIKMVRYAEFLKAYLESHDVHSAENY